MMKKILFLFAFLAVALPLPGAEPLEASIRPERIAVGDLAEFTLTVHGSGEPQISSLPKLDGGRWLENSIRRSYVNINGEVTASYTIPIQATAAGELKIPAFDVMLNGRKVRTSAGVVTVIPASEKPVSGPEETLTLAEAVFGRIAVPDQRRVFYVGEEIPLNLELWIRDGVQARPTRYPELGGLGGAVFRDYGAVNPEQRKFDRPVQHRRTLDGAGYTEVVFPTAFQPTTPGRITPEAEIEVAVAERRSSSRNRMPSMFDDDFFDSFFQQSRWTPHTVRFQPGPELEIKPLPPPPAGSSSLGLIGRWQLKAGLDRAESKVGEPVTLILTATGSGSAELVRAPKPDFPGFRVYPPEIEKSKTGTLNRIEIRYVLLPLKESDGTIDLSSAAFNPQTETYQTWTFRLPLKVAPGDIPASVTTATLSPEPETPSPPEPKVRETLFPQKSVPGRRVELPLRRNFELPLWGMLILGPALALILRFRERRRKRLADDPAFAERRELRRRRGALLRRLKSALPPEELAALIRREALPMLAECYRLPHGASAGEIAERCDTPELRELLIALDAASFRGDASPREPIPAARLDALRRVLKKWSVVLLLLLAAPQLTAQQHETAADPAELYNLGCESCYKGDLATARHALARAHLLAPRDAETLENLNLINRKLLQPEEGSAATPRELLTWCRDRFRPDEYLLAAAAAWMIFWLAVGLRERLGTVAFRSVTAAAAAAALLCAAAVVSQLTGPYADSRAVVVGGDLPLRSLPTEAGGRIEATVPAGSSARILDASGGWVRAEINGCDGWAPSNRIKPIFPEGLF